MASIVLPKSKSEGCMASHDLETRVAALEAEMPRLRMILGSSSAPAEPGWRMVIGLFEADPLFEEAMRMGREHRESTRPAPRKRKKV